MFFFSTRSAARNFASGNRKVVDLGSSKAKRWAVKVI